VIGSTGPRRFDELTDVERILVMRRGMLAEMFPRTRLRCALCLGRIHFMWTATAGIRRDQAYEDPTKLIRGYWNSLPGHALHARECRRIAMRLRGKDHQQRYASRRHISDHAAQPADRSVMIANHDARLCSRHGDPGRFPCRWKGRREPALRDKKAEGSGEDSVRRCDQNNTEALGAGFVTDAWFGNG
jgi:hypothetical protein